MLFFAQALTSLSNGPSYVALFLRQVAALHFATKKAPLRLAIYRGVICGCAIYPHYTNGIIEVRLDFNLQGDHESE